MVGTILVLKVGIVTLTAYAFARLRFKEGYTFCRIAVLHDDPAGCGYTEIRNFKAFGITDSMWSIVLHQFSMYSLFYGASSSWNTETLRTSLT